MAAPEQKGKNMGNDFILEMKHIFKIYPGVKAVDDMNLSVRRGTVHALMGENGAGKSTLMKILMGYEHMNSGEIVFDGKPLNTANIRTVLSQGISMIYQELNALDNMTVSEDIFCGREPHKGIKFIVDKKTMNNETKKLLEMLAVESIKPTDKVEKLSMAQKQLLEIAKAVSYNSKLIIMDEPTSAITEAEVANLFRVINSLKDKGVSFIYITHKMDEIDIIADDVTVMRDGQYVGTKSVKELKEGELITMMVGREIKDIYPKRKTPPAEEIKLEVENLTVDKICRDVSFSVKKGEIFGLAGLMGAGRTEIMESVFGMHKLISGTIKIDGKEVKNKKPRDAIKRRMAFLTEERKKDGCYLFLSVYFNTMILKWMGKGFLVKDRSSKAECSNAIERFRIKTPNMGQTINSLSGGNQQKVLFARWLIADPDILILDEPTRGIDIGSKNEIYHEIIKLAEEGKTVIMISSEMMEILGMCDRIMVIHEGEVASILNKNEATQERIMSFAAGLGDIKE